MKRAFDVLVAASILLVIWPVAAVIAVAIRIDSPGAVFFRQQRVGLHGRLFDILKFRTMRDDPATAMAPAPVPQVSDFSQYVFDPLYGGKRYTRIGHFLRSTSLDELPNFINVLKGDLSIVGPRPEVPELVEQYRPEFRRRHNVRPGITGLAQVSGRGTLTYEETMDYDLKYVDHHSFARDLLILARTLPVVLGRKGAR